MEQVRLLFGSVLAMTDDDPIWVFLASRLFHSEGPAGAGCIVLDWLGFSRQNRDFSMGCAQLKLETIFPAPVTACEARSGAGGFGASNIQNCSWRQIKLNSDFLQ
jgi:hypothetical protein